MQYINMLNENLSLIKKINHTTPTQYRRPHTIQTLSLITPSA